MNHNFSFMDGELILRPLSFNDLEPLRKLRNRAENRIWFFHNNQIDADSQKKWYGEYLNKANDYMFSVFLANNPEEFVGAIAIYDYNSDSNCYEVGRLMLDSKKMPRKHMSFEVVNAVCNIAYKYLGEDVSLKAEVYADNSRSMNAFVSNGFSEADNKYINNKSVKTLIKAQHND